ncbi:MAG: HAD family hydrolase [Actinomycetota bacterium]
MEIPRPPQAVTFDCWSTLIADVDWEGALMARARHLQEIARRDGVELDSERARELMEGSWLEHVSKWRDGKMFGPEGAARWCLVQLGIEVTEQVAGQLADTIAEATSRVGVRVVEGAAHALETVRARGIPTALICDTGFTPGRVVRRLLAELEVHLDQYLFSDEVGVPKPQQGIFTAALQAVGAPAEKSVHIGDLRRTDIAGARAAGMATIRFAGVHDDAWTEEEAQGEEGDVVLHHWDDLYDALGI